ncbi:dynein light chain Tctex-type 5-like isoform X2 [Littorina saxatilis]|uniref:Uncharacterized protein n=2 Tax=Littorina saxatilis TaxID=31220 RepID=A0AAN9GAJ0_9CAEN
MSTAVRRQSIVDHGGAGGGGTTTTTAAGNIHSSSRTALIMTSAQSRRVSFSQAPPISAVSRSYENSYKTEPEKEFSPAAAKRVIREVMEAMLNDQKYDSATCNQLTLTVADVIKKRVKELGFARYKIVTNIAIGQADETSVAFASRCVWNVNFDSFAEYTYKNGSLFAVGLVYALYCD